MMLAAKYYVLAAVYVIARSEKPHLRNLQPSALSTLAAIDYKIGNWFDATISWRLALGSYLLDSTDPETLEEHPEIHPCVFNFATMLVIGERIDRDLSNQSAAYLYGGPFDSWITEVKTAATSHWGELSAFDLWTKLENEFSARPFSDAEPFRTITWSALGLTWHVKWENSFETHPLAEYVGAVLQIFLADLAGADLSLLPTRVDLEVVRAPRFSMAIKPSNAERIWLVGFPDSLGAANTDWKDASTTMVQILGTLLADVSVMKSAALMDFMKERFKQGLSHKLLAGLRYPVIYRNTMSTDVFNSFSRSGQNRLPKERKFKIVESPELGWVGGLGPGYSEAEARAALKNRYHYYLDPIRVTVERLAADPNIRATIDRLKSSGWLDWHILGAICTVAMNYRISGGRKTEPALKELNFLAAMQRPELEADPPIPHSVFTEESLRFSMNTIMFSSLETLGFECRQRTPDFPAIARFLGDRFRYWSDDIPHQDPFALSFQR